jgi:L-arabinose isomerase
LKDGKIGLFAGGIEVYWKGLGMKDLPERLDRDINRLIESLSGEFEVVYPGLVGSKEDAARAGKVIREADVDLALMYHATYLDDAMSIAFLDEIGNTFSVLFQSQGFGSFTEPLDLVDAGRSWGTNSSVQLPGSLRRLRPDLKYGYVFGGLTDPQSLQQIKEYAYAARAIKNLKGKRFGYLPHRCTGVPMYDTFPDEPRLMGHTGIEIEYLYIIDLVNEMKNVTGSECEKLTEQLYADYDVVEPSRVEVADAARQAIALERMVKQNKLDEISVDFPAG